MTKILAKSESISTTKRSVFGKIWCKKEYSEDLASSIAKQAEISDLLASLVSSRVSSVEDACGFLSPKIRDYLPDPFHLKDMDVAVKRLIKAIRLDEKITIFADYDVDGATSSALIRNVLKQIGVRSEIYVPDRIAEGYGPSGEAMHKIKSNGTSLVITVDCGSVAFEALEEAANIGLDIIVIDHHISLDSLPKSVAVVNPNRLDETSDCTHLAAVGVSFLFMVGLITKLRAQNYFTDDKKEPNLINQLDIVALGTVCDVMKIVGLNRAFVAQGIRVARRRYNIGYSALCDVAGLDEAINAYHLGFVLGPRINAGGRVGKSNLGAELLSTSSKVDAAKIAAELDCHNNDRKAIELAIIQEAMQLADVQRDNSMLFIIGEGWHPGVIGIVAGRLKEQYNKPVAVIAVNDNIAKASCRSVPGVDFGSALLEAKNMGLLEAGGGHAMAAGFTAMYDKLDELQQFLNKRFAADLEGSLEHLIEKYDQIVTTSAATIDLIKEVSKLEPFGVGNSAPIFKFEKLYVLKADIVGGSHIRVTFAPSYSAYKGESGKSSTLQAISFGAVGTLLADVLLSKKPMDLTVFGTLKINSFQNRESVQLHLRDVIVEG